MRAQQIFDIRQQSTCETCLSVCLIAFLRQKGIKIDDSEEINILVEGIKFTKLDYSTGHLVYICNKYPVRIEQYIDFPEFQEKLTKLNLPDALKLIPQKIDKKFLQQMTNESPVIIYLDKYHLEKIFHYYHFVILISLNDQKSLIFDPGDGKYKEIATKILMKAIQSLRNKFKVSPKLITIL